MESRSFTLKISKGLAKLNLRRVAGPVYVEGFRDREPDILAAILTLEDAKPLFLELRRASVAFH